MPLKHGKNVKKTAKKSLIGERKIKIFGFIKKISKRGIFGLGMVLLIANLMWLYYFNIGPLLIKLHNITHEEQPITDRINNMIATNFKHEMREDLFTMNCDLGEEGAVGRFMLEWNKMCVKENATPYVLNHELVHYALWNLPMYQKLKAKSLIKKQIKAIAIIDKKLTEDGLSMDDWNYFKILKDHVNVFAGDESYKFYDMVELGIFTHRGNEEYISYAIGPIVDIVDNKLVFVEYELKEPLLQEIDQRYKQIYSLLADF